MNTQNAIKLSSSWTKFGLYVGLLIVLVMLPVMIFATGKQDFHIGMLIGPIVYLAILGFIIYPFIYSSEATLYNDRIILKKMFRPAKEYSFDKIGYPSSFQLKRTKYITVEMQNEDGTPEKYLIINSRTIFSSNDNDTEEILIGLRNYKKVD